MINYINGDEALFEDASLPRDRFWFRIANWVNTRKQDWKTANSWIMMAQYVAMSDRTVATTNINWWMWSQFTKADTWDVKTTKLWNPYCEISWNDVRITKGWLYLLQWVASFVFSDFYTYWDWVTVYWCAMKVWIWQKVDNWYEWLVVQTWKQATTTEILEVNYYWWLEAWTTLNVWFNANGSNSSWATRYNYRWVTTLNLYRLS